MPVVSAIIPKWHENSCDYLLIIYFQASIRRDLAIKPWPGPQSERTRMLCQRVLTCSVMKQKALGGKHVVVNDLQESQKVAQGRPGYDAQQP